jgi:hypothetical protein
MEKNRIIAGTHNAVLIDCFEQEWNAEGFYAVSSSIWKNYKYKYQGWAKQ